MNIKVQLNNLRIAPRKTRLVADLIRNKNLPDARDILEFTVKRAGGPVLKLLNSAAASAKNTYKLDEAQLYISEVKVDGGPILKRSFPMSRGRAYPIMKRTSHITLILSEKKISAEKVKDQKSKIVKVKKNLLEK